MSTSRRLLALFGAQVVTLASSQACKDDFDSEYTIYMPYQNLTITVPALPPAGDSYSYAKDNALVAIPAQCAEEFATDIAKAADLPNKQECDPQGMKYLRIGDLTGGWAKLEQMTSCAAGLVVGFHGSGGPGWGQVQYAAMFSGMGFVHIILDSMAMPDSMGLKGKTPLKSGEDITTTDYCGSYSASEGSCSWPDKPFCYSTKFENVVADSDKYRSFVEGVYQIRKREVDWFADTTASLLQAFEKVYAVGNSEGAMVLSRYFHADFNQHLDGVILDGYACEFNYFQSCAQSAMICEDQCDKTTPMLNLIGEDDEYFGRVETSMAQRVAADANGYGAAGGITGNCHKTFSDQGFSDTTTIVLGDTEHTPKYWNDNLVRSVVADFVGHRDDFWVEPNQCTKEDGVYECPLIGAGTCMPGWTRNADETNMCMKNAECMIAAAPLDNCEDEAFCDTNSSCHSGLQDVLAKCTQGESYYDDDMMMNIPLQKMAMFASARCMSDCHNAFGLLAMYCGGDKMCSQECTGMAETAMMTCTNDEMWPGEDYPISTMLNEMKGDMMKECSSSCRSVPKALAEQLKARRCD